MPGCLQRLGRDLHLERVQKELSIFEAARLLGVAYQTIDLIELGKLDFDIDIYQALFELYDYRCFVASGDEYEYF